MINFKASTFGTWRTTKGTCINDCTYIFKAPILNNHWHLTLWHWPSYLKKRSSHSHWQCLLWLPDHIVTFILENRKFFIYPMPRWNYSAYGIMLYTKWTMRSTQLEDTEQYLFLAESMHPSSTTINLMQWLTSQMRLFWQGWYQLQT